MATPNKEASLTEEQISVRRKIIESEDLILEILKRVPVKSVLKLRLLSKSFDSLISSPYFVRQHHFKSCIAQLLVSSLDNCNIFVIKKCFLSQLLNHQSCDSVDLNYPQKPHSDVEIVGSCFGLVCLAIDECFFFLWNPSTRKYRNLPVDDYKFRNSDTVYGFGYDDSVYDFKVVSVKCYVPHLEIGYRTTVRVFSSKSNSWSSVNPLPSVLSVPLFDSGKFVNGALHWFWTPFSQSPPSCFILSFSMRSELYDEVEQPTYDLLPGTKRHLILGILNNCLCILCNYEATRSDLWIMNEYGNKQSWTKLLSMPYLNEPSAPLFMSPKGDIILKLGSRLSVYSSTDGKFKEAEISDFSECMEAITYTESLFPSPEEANFWFSEGQSTGVSIVCSYMNKHLGIVDIVKCNMNELLNHGSCDPIQIRYPKFPHGCVCVVGSCNGVVCIALDKKKLLLWNPSERKHRELPTFCADLEVPGTYISHGFGYDDFNKEFKVVSVFCYIAPTGRYETTVCIFSSNLNRWTVTDNFPDGKVPCNSHSHSNNSGEFVDGAVHWLGSSESQPLAIIVSFNLKSGKYSEVQQPAFDVISGTECSLMLGTLGDCLCILCNYKENRTDLWIMEEYNVRKSWTKLFTTVPYLMEPSAPLFMSSNGDLVLKVGSKLCVYSSNGSLCKDLEIFGFDSSDCMNAYIYIEGQLPFNDDSNLWVHDRFG